MAISAWLPKRLVRTVFVLLLLDRKGFFLIYMGMFECVSVLNFQLNVTIVIHITTNLLDADKVVKVIHWWDYDDDSNVKDAAVVACCCCWWYHLQFIRCKKGFWLANVLWQLHKKIFFTLNLFIVFGQVLNGVIIKFAWFYIHFY